MTAPACMGLLPASDKSGTGEQKCVLGGNCAQGVSLLQPVRGLAERGLGAIGGEDQIHSSVFQVCLGRGRHMELKTHIYTLY